MMAIKMWLILERFLSINFKVFILQVATKKIYDNFINIKNLLIFFIMLIKVIVLLEGHLYVAD